MHYLIYLVVYLLIINQGVVIIHTENTPVEANPPKLLDQVRDKPRVNYYYIHTGQSYVDWIKRFVLFHGKYTSLKASGISCTHIQQASRLPCKLAILKQWHSLTLCIFYQQCALIKLIAIRPDDLRGQLYRLFQWQCL